MTTRFPTRGHFATYNGTAPIEASSGSNTRRRLNPRENCGLNPAIQGASGKDTQERLWLQRGQPRILITGSSNGSLPGPGTSTTRNPPHRQGTRPHTPKTDPNPSAV